ncbi:MAG: UDP-glucose/GDP-mannose dehydrogenase family protein [Planctomycetes bacterium]|nr:UDP-glucose/GDP-mannose dehydrogenase family protein [Planctomycetota bacterium]
MKLAVVGTGYVGLVAGTCFSDSGNHVICVDIDERKIEQLKQGEIPIYEPGLADLVRANLRTGRLEFTTDLEAAVKRSTVVFMAVGTPALPDGSADLSATLSVAETVGKSMDGYRIVVMKSTVPVGTHRKVSEVIARYTEHPFTYVSNPEFMKEGAAIEDFTKPDRVVIGTNDPAVVEIMRELYAPFMRKSERVHVMDPASAELTKYAANVMLAARISLMNEIAGLCEKVGADVEKVRRGVGSDSRIGNAFLFPGVGYGGSCFPKDVSALIAVGESVGHPMEIASATDRVNQRQRRVFAQRVIDYFGDQCRETTLAIWGLAFKARTDDVRESPAIAAIEMFLDQGMRIRAHDPQANETAAAELPRTGVKMYADAYEAVQDADALVIFTDWGEFRSPDFDALRSALRGKVIFDGRNMYDPVMMAKRGFRYECVGRPTIPVA